MVEFQQGTPGYPAIGQFVGLLGGFEEHSVYKYKYKYKYTSLSMVILPLNGYQVSEKISCLSVDIKSHLNFRGPKF